MFTKHKLAIAAALLSITIIYCWCFPEPKYISTDILAQLKIPLRFNGWEGNDVAQEWNLDEDKYNFINQVLQREYLNREGNGLYLIILNAGNFHEPRVCSSGAGYKVRDIKPAEFHTSHNMVKTYNICIEKNEERFLMMYWICINKDIVDWTEQKLKQWWFSLINK